MMMTDLAGGVAVGKIILIKNILIEIAVLIISGAILYFIPALWSYSNDATTSHMSKFWMGLLILSILQCAVIYFAVLSAWCDRVYK